MMLSKNNNKRSRTNQIKCVGVLCWVGFLLFVSLAQIDRWLTDPPIDWINQSMHQWLTEWMNDWLTESINQAIDDFSFKLPDKTNFHKTVDWREMNEWMNQRINQWVSEWMNERMTESINQSMTFRSNCHTKTNFDKTADWTEIVAMILSLSTVLEERFFHFIHLQGRWIAFLKIANVDPIPSIEFDTPDYRNTAK